MQQMFEQCTQMMGGMMGPGMMGGMMMPMFVGMVFVIALVAAGIVLLVRLLRNRTNSNEQTAYTLLAERYARGEIGLEEYQERRSVLRGH